MCSPTTKESAYFTLVRPLLEYASIAWSPHSDKYTKKIELVQRSAARFITQNYKRDPGNATTIIETLGWDTLELRRTIARVSMFYKIQNKLVDITLPDEIQKNNTITRSANSLPFCHIRSNKVGYRNSFFPAVIPIWKSSKCSCDSRNPPDVSVTCQQVLDYQELHALTREGTRLWCSRHGCQRYLLRGYEVFNQHSNYNG